MRFEEWNEIQHAWLKTKTTAEAIESASLLRIPVAPIGNGRTVLTHEQLLQRGVYGPAAEGWFQQPRRPYRIDDIDPPAPRAAPALGANTRAAAFSTRSE